MASAPVPQPQDGPQTYATWLDLPPELRFEILNLVSQGDGNDRLDFYGGERPDRLASYATVCSEWQSFFEKMTFRHLLVDDTAVQEFARIMSGKNARRTTYVRHLLFLIVLPGYSCPSCHKLESWFDIYRNNRVFTAAMEMLLGILSTWVPRGRSGGLTLELAIKSSSDSKHYYNDFTTHHDYPFRSWDNRDETMFQRQMSPLALSKLIHESLVHITSFRLERFCRRTNEEEEKYLKDFREHVLSSLPENLESFHYFADNFRGLGGPTPVQTKPISFMELLYNHGHRFKRVSVVEPLDTKNRIAEMQYPSANALTTPLLPAQWHKLERVCFRSGILRPDNGLGLINRLLLLTAPVAETLPNLVSLEIFNTSIDRYGCDVPSCLFRYSVEHSDAMLFWESYWQLPLDTKTAEFKFCPEVKYAWEKAAVAHTGHGITILINEPKGTTEADVELRQRYWQRGKPRLAEVFKLDAIHPFTRTLMSLECQQKLF
ncbi:hypothetical protein H633G_09482 [Metarhizium anisopliae BRIP 53284]|nr:hypothetical protein H633G_09482 [Metarhizium anisopliae BRIP 53284]